MSKNVLSNFIIKQAAFFWGCLFLFGCENSQRALNEWKEKKEMVEEAKNIQSYFSQGGQLRSLLTAPLMLRYSRDTSYVEFPKSLRMVFFDSLGKEQSRLAPNQYNAINISLEYLKRGNKDNALKENVFRFSVGFNFTDLWFVKRKYE